LYVSAGSRPVMVLGLNPPNTKPPSISFTGIYTIGEEKKCFVGFMGIFLR
jgi:hypothetical protein